MSKHEQDESIEAAPDSGTASLRPRAEPEAADEFENEEERRFFSAPPAHEEEHTVPSLEPVVAEAGHGDDVGPERTPAERAWLARAEARRATLQRWVGLAVVAGAAALVVAGADRYVTANSGTMKDGASTVLPMVAPTPPQKTNNTPSDVAAKRIHGAPSPDAVPAAPPSATTAPVSAPPSTPSATAAAVSVPSIAPSATSVPVLAPATPSATPVPVAAPSATPPASASASSAASPVASEADAAGLRDKARSLLATGHSRDGVAFARAAVESDPLDARSYVLLGAGLQDLGDWAAARDVFQECTRKATRGASGACQYFARR